MRRSGAMQMAGQPGGCRRGEAVAARWRGRAREVRPREAEGGQMRVDRDWTVNFSK
ncbi:MAG: hypothetical protein GAK40_00802 [Burkholderia plantarii]|nr:MAG: hypothetical protein GAK40_00802 [Burkholderia plantarii]